MDSQGVRWGVILLQEFVGPTGVVPACTSEGHRVLVSAPSPDGRRRAAIIENARCVGGIVSDSEQVERDSVALTLLWRSRRLRLISSHLDVGRYKSMFLKNSNISNMFLGFLITLARS